MSGIAFGFMCVVSYILLVNYFGSRSYAHLMSQIILQKQYNKMYKQKRVSIVMGKVIQQNAPIKYAHIIEGYSDTDLMEGEES